MKHIILNILVLFLFGTSVLAYGGGGFILPQFARQERSIGADVFVAAVVKPNIPWNIRNLNNEFAINTIRIKVKNIETAASITLFKLKNETKSNLILYQALEIKNNIENLENVEIQFRVNKEWIKSNEVDAEDIVIFWDNEKIETNLTEDNKYYYYLCNFDSFSKFYIGVENLQDLLVTPEQHQDTSDISGDTEEVVDVIGKEIPKKTNIFFRIIKWIVNLFRR